MRKSQNLIIRLVYESLSKNHLQTQLNKYTERISNQNIQEMLRLRMLSYVNVVMKSIKKNQKLIFNYEDC